jgi:caffeoyl-CoA O-methyltransferase
MHFLNPKIDHYCVQHSAPEPPLLQELAAHTRQHVAGHRMLSGHFAGRFLALISHLLRPTCIVEVGTYTGYSALCLAEGLLPGGVLHTLDPSKQTNAVARQFFDRSPWAAQLHIHEAPALQTLAALDARPELVFIDADKDNYLNYYQALVPKMPSGGVILTDNVLWSGKVVDNSFCDKTTKSIRAFNEQVFQDQRVEPLMLPIRDGIFVLRKR